MIARTHSNSKDITERTLAEQAQADRRLFEAMRQAEDEAFYSRPEWLPEPGIEDDYDDIRRGGAGSPF